MSTTNLNQFHNEVLQDSALQEQFNTATVDQELSDAELESVAGGFLPLPWVFAQVINAAVGGTSMGLSLTNREVPTEAGTKANTKGLTGGFNDWLYAEN